MGMLATVLCLLTCPAPQDPGAAALLPESALVAVLVDRPARLQEELATTGLGALLRDEARTGLSGMLSAQAREFGIDEAMLQDLAGAGLGFAWCGLTAGGVPDLVLAAQCADAAAAERLESLLTRRLPTGTPEDWQGARVLPCTTPGGRGWLWRDGSALRLATDAGRLRQLIGGAPSLAGDPALHAKATGGRPLLAILVRPASCATALAPLSRAQGIDLAPALAALGLDRMERAMFTIAATDGQVHERLHVSWPEPRRGLFAALLGTGVPVAGLAPLAPPATQTFAAGQLDWAAIVEGGIGLADALQPDAAAMAQAFVAGFREQHGVDLQADIVGQLRGPLAMAQWNDADGVHLLWWQGLGDAQRFGNALAKVLEASGLPAEPTEVTGQRAWRLAAPQAPGLPVVQPTLLITGGRLLIASTPKALAAALQQASDPILHPGLAAFAGEIPPDACWASWSSAGALAEGQPGGLAALLGAMGDQRAFVRRDADGITCESRSGLGTLGAAAFAALGDMSGLAAARQHAAGRSDTRVDSLPTTTTAEPPLRQLVLRMHAVADACRTYRAARHTDQDQDGKGEHGTLAQLLAGQVLQPEVAGSHDPATDTCTGDGWRLRIAVPLETDRAEERFLVMAWPADARPGPALCLDQAGNFVIDETSYARQGIDLLQPGDVQATDIGAAFLPQWRPMDPAVASPPARQQEIRQLAAVEREGAAIDPDQLTRLLTSPSTAVAARAAWLAGRRQVAEVVPELCTMVVAHGSAEVRLQAIQALFVIADQRCQQAVTEALGDADVRVRAQAAACLGRLGNQASIDPLLGLLAERGADGNPGADGSADLIAALLALNDLGQPQCLLPAASALPGPRPATATALSYLFQEVSPKLPTREEATLLMAVLDHGEPMLRRYAIQRLGELREPTTALALEGRLATETTELQPLVRISLAAVRGEGTAPADTMERVGTNLELIGSHVGQRWNAMDALRRSMVFGLGVLALGAVIGLILVRRHAARQAGAMIWAAAPATAEVFADEAQAAAGEAEVGDVTDELFAEAGTPATPDWTGDDVLEQVPEPGWGADETNWEETPVTPTGEPTEDGIVDDDQGYRA